MTKKTKKIIKFTLIFMAFTLLITFLTLIDTSLRVVKDFFYNNEGIYQRELNAWELAEARGEPSPGEIWLENTLDLFS